MFFKSLLLTKPGQHKQYNFEIFLLFKTTVFYLNILLFIAMIKAEFSASLLQSSESHDFSEIITTGINYILKYIQIENSYFK